MKKIRKIAGYSIYILIVLLITLIIKGVCFQRTVVSGDSMNSTLYDGDSLLVDKLSYRFSDPKRFDIIVFPYSEAEKVYYVKRIIGLPGETVVIREGVIMIDDHVLPYKYNRDVIVDAGLASTPVTLGEKEYFVMGDNVNDSVDSRSIDVGNIDKDRMIGKVFFRISPLSRIGTVD